MAITSSVGKRTFEHCSQQGCASMPDRIYVLAGAFELPVCVDHAGDAKRFLPLHHRTEYTNARD